MPGGTSVLYVHGSHSVPRTLPWINCSLFSHFTDAEAETRRVLNRIPEVSERQGGEKFQIECWSSKAHSLLLFPVPRWGGAYSLRKWPVLISIWRWNILVIFCIIGGGCSSTVFGDGVSSFWGSRPELWVVLVWGLYEASEDYIHHQELMHAQLDSAKPTGSSQPNLYLLSIPDIGMQENQTAATSELWLRRVWVFI